MITVKQIRDFLSQYDENDQVYLAAFNSLCGGNRYSLEVGYVDAQGEFFSQEDLPDRVADYERYLERHREDWSEKKILETSERIQKLKNSKPQPIIFVHN